MGEGNTRPFVLMLLFHNINGDRYELSHQTIMERFELSNGNDFQDALLALPSRAVVDAKIRSMACPERLIRHLEQRSGSFSDKSFRLEEVLAALASALDDYSAIVAFEKSEAIGKKDKKRLGTELFEFLLEHNVHKLREMAEAFFETQLD